jgi:hypothetical protein
MLQNARRLALMVVLLSMSYALTANGQTSNDDPSPAASRDTPSMETPSMETPSSEAPSSEAPVKNWIGHIPKSRDFWTAASETSYIALRARQNGDFRYGSYPPALEQIRIDLQMRFALDKRGKLTLGVALSTGIHGDPAETFAMTHNPNWSQKNTFGVRYLDIGWSPTKKQMYNFGALRPSADLLHSDGMFSLDGAIWIDGARAQIENPFNKWSSMVSATMGYIGQYYKPNVYEREFKAPNFFEVTVRISPVKFLRLWNEYQVFGHDQFDRTMVTFLTKEIQPRFAKFFDHLNIEVLSKNRDWAAFGAMLRKATDNTHSWLSFSAIKSEDVDDNVLLREGLFDHPRTWQFSGYHERNVSKNWVLYTRGSYTFTTQRIRMEVGARMNEPIAFLNRALRKTPPTAPLEDPILGVR